jgi:hypothetical protein
MIDSPRYSIMPNAISTIVLDTVNSEHYCAFQFRGAGHADTAKARTQQHRQPGWCGMKTYRFRIARMNGRAIQTMTYIGHFDRIPAGWSLVMRRVVTRSAA